MLNMENAEEVMQILERFTRLKQKEIPKELDDYMHYVAKTGDTVFKWSSLKYLFREKLLNVIKNFHDTSPRVDDIPQYPNVDPFNYESMKSSLLERLELFNAAPFTVQRLCELLTEPRKQYSRIDKFMRALEKNILVVSTIEPGRKRTESENGDSLDSVVNGDVSLDVNVDIDMENEVIFTAETPNNATSSNPSSLPSSNLTHKSDDDILPNPKKPKLDLEETDDAETEAATKSITSNTTDSADSAVEKAMTEETSEIADNKKKEKPVAEESHEEKPVAVNNITTAATESKKEIKDTEIEKMEEDPPAPASVENNKTTGQTTEVAKKTEEKKEAVNTPLAAEEAIKLPEIDAAKPVDNIEKEEKIDDEPEGKKKDCVEKVPEKQDVKKVIEDDDKVIKEEISDKETQNGDNKVNEEKTEINITAANTEKVNDDKPTEPAQKETNATRSGDKLEEISSDKKVEATVAAAVVEESKEEVKTLKADVKPCTDTKESTKIDEGKSPEEVVTASTTKTSAPLEAIPATNNSVEPVEKEDVVDEQPPIIKSASPAKESLEAPTELKEKEKESETEKIAELTESTAPVAESSDSVAPVVIEPVVASDQPMDQNLESIAEAEPMVPAIVVEAAAPVEEVVMGDSIEMATDAIEPTKDEPAGMEVDDTSQEAMDQ